MTQPVISVRGISKKYKLGATLSHDTLRDHLTHGFKSLWHSSHKGQRTKDQGQKQNNEIWAVKDIAFDVNQGEVIGIIGRNGAGKSRLLKILSRITEPTEGYADIHGRVGSLLEVGTGFHSELIGCENMMYKYELIIFWSEEDGRYVVEVPELPGCMADGETYEEAIKNVQVVISEWMETARSLGREIPQPKGKLAYA